MRTPPALGGLLYHAEGGIFTPVEVGFPLYINNRRHVLGFNPLTGELQIETEAGVENFSPPEPLSHFPGPGFTDSGDFPVRGLSGKIYLATRSDKVKVQFEYERVHTTETGLDFGDITRDSFFGVEIELRRENGQVVGSGITLDDGVAEIDFPQDRTGKFVAVARPLTEHASVGPAGGDFGEFEVKSEPFSLGVGAEAATHKLLAKDEDRANAPFAILHTIRDGARFMTQNASGFESRFVTVAWDERSAAGPFLLNGGIRLGGKRPTNSDEFDEGVILAAWFKEQLAFNPSLGFGGNVQRSLAAVNGLPYRLETPRAFVDGFATFFAAAVLEDEGKIVNTQRRTFLVELEDGGHPLRRPGVYDPHSIAAALWDLTDAPDSDDDPLALSFSQLWDALLSVAEPDRPDLTVVAYCARLEEQLPGIEADLTQLLSAHGIQHRNPVHILWPPLLRDTGFGVDGEVDPAFQILADKQELNGVAEGVQHYRIPAVVAAGLTNTLFVQFPAPQPAPLNKLGVLVNVLDAQTLQPRQTPGAARPNAIPSSNEPPFLLAPILPDQDVIVRITGIGSARRATFARYLLVLASTPPAAAQRRRR